MKLRAQRIVTFEKTKIGRIVAADEDRTDRVVVSSPDEESDDFLSSSGDSDNLVFSADMMAELRRKLREAEAREEASGVRTRPSSEPMSLEDAIDPFADIEIDVDLPQTLEELEEVVSQLPEVEIALGPHTESNFYTGLDTSHPDGVFLANNVPVAVGTPVFANVVLPAGFAFRTPAIVEWAREADPISGMPAGIGLKMCGLDARMRGLIKRFGRFKKPFFYSA